MKLTAQQVYQKLIDEEKILDIEGKIQFYLGNVSITVCQKDVVGNIMQEWLQGWFDANGIEYDLSVNTQMPPDFFLNKEDHKKNLLEVKAFNRNGSPGFDIADFRMYAEEIREKPYMLDVDYLIFGYDMSDEGIVTIKDVWLKKVWEITRRSESYALNLQVKDGVIHKIRPGVWYSVDQVDYKIFENLEDFICAVEETTFKEPHLRDSIASTWLNTFQRNYKVRNGHELNVPRWHEIKDKYDLKAVRQKEKAIRERDKAREKVERIQARIEDLQIRLANAKTEKQIQKLNESLEKAQITLSNAQSNLGKKQDFLDGLG